MKTNPFNDTWLFLMGAQPDEMNLGPGVGRWAIVALFILLLAAGLVIAIRNWSVSAEQRSAGHVLTWIARTLVGAMWFQGSLWKLPLGTSNGLYYWTQQMVEHSAFDWHRALVADLILPAFPVVDPLVLLAELMFAASLMLGLGVRVTGVVSMLFVANLWIGLYRHPGEWPWNYVFLALLMGAFSLHAAGRSLGLDAILRRRSPTLRGDTANKLIAIAC